MYRLSSIYLSLNPLGSLVIYCSCLRYINVLFTTMVLFPWTFTLHFRWNCKSFIILTYPCSVLKVNFKVFLTLYSVHSFGMSPMYCDTPGHLAGGPVQQVNNPMPELTLSPQSGIYEFGYRARYQLSHPSQLPSNPCPLCCHPSPLLTQPITPS